MPPELGPFLWTRKTRLANHSKLIGGASAPARLELKVDGSFDLDDRGHSPSRRRYADPSYVGTPPFHTWAVPIDSKTGIASRVVMNGNPGLDVQASVDLDGLKKLQAMTEKYQGIS